MKSPLRRRISKRPRLPGCIELERLLERRNTHSESPRAIDRVIAQKFRRTSAVLVLDMASFSISVQRYGIIHHLSTIHRMRRIVGTVIRRCGGRVVKFDADNCFAAFARADTALRAAREINASLTVANTRLAANSVIHVSIGIGHGPILLARDDFFGDEVNLASKLGEDIALRDEVLLTERARRKIGKGRGRFEVVNLSVSGLRFRAYRLID